MAESHIIGCVLGTAVGDALGLPYEGVSRRRQQRLLGPPDRHRFLFGKGMVSDDTEHTCMVMQALITSGSSPEEFAIEFSRRLKRWFVLLPAGVGKATMRSCLKLWCGIPPERSGVFSAGNGPAMRSAIFGAVFDDIDQLLRFVRISTRITHTDPKAEYGAAAVAIASSWQRRHGKVVPETFAKTVTEHLGPEAGEFIDLLQKVVASVTRGETTSEFATGMGLARGVSGYTYHTVPVALHAWMSHPLDYQAAVTSVICCGGDADTPAAIVGGIVGASVGDQGIPPDLLAGLVEWPRSVTWMIKLAKQLHESTIDSAAMDAPYAIKLNAIAELSRNLIFLAVVLVHGARRLLPPY
ncbi:MAG: ADP-ribosylglycohydrolase family protein [Fuerstiella sp.]